MNSKDTQYSYKTYRLHQIMAKYQQKILQEVIKEIHATKNSGIESITHDNTIQSKIKVEESETNSDSVNLSE